MLAGRVEGANQRLRAPEAWRPERDGPCRSLHVKVDACEGGVRTYTSAWYPNPDEITAICRGAAVHLTIVSASHPPVRLGVGETPPPPRVA